MSIKEARSFTVGIVDNDACASAMIGLCLTRALPVCGVLWRSEHAQSALEHLMFDRSKPDVVIVDLVLNAISGVDLCRSIRERFPSIGLVCVTAYPLQRYETQVAGAGAQALFGKKDVGSQAFMEAVLTASRGETLRTPPFMSARESYDRLRGGRDGDGRQPLSQSLTSREIAVLHLYAQGFDTGEIASRLHISTGTVFSHVHHAVGKLNVANRKEAIRSCVANHLW